VTTVLVGAGLLGAAVARTLRRDGELVLVASVPWSDPDAAVDAVLRSIGEAGPDWRLAWCAGSGVVGSSEGVLAAEVDVARRVVAGIGVPPSAVLLASSAGGVYAGSTTPPFTERHEVRPLAPYGRAKLDIEACFADLAARGSRLAVARFANLYGPGQDLTKPQGLVSQLCRSRLTGQPLVVYVDTDTLRDYVYADDAGAVGVAMLDRIAGEQPGTVVTKIVASGSPTTISGLVGAATRALRRRPPVVHARAAGGAQVRDLRLRSVVWRDLDRLVSTPLVVGLRRTADEVAAQHRAGLLDVTRK
jgi:UDP-glucose 4-epimerase